MMNRALLVRLHVLLAAFMLPAFLMFLVTGALYTWGIRGEYETQKIQLVLDAALPSDQSGLAAIVTRELQVRDLAVPSGNQSLKEVAHIAWSPHPAGFFVDDFLNLIADSACLSRA